jgi:hypothetical protein
MVCHGKCHNALDLYTNIKNFSAKLGSICTELTPYAMALQVKDQNNNNVLPTQGYHTHHGSLTDQHDAMV